MIEVLLESWPLVLLLGTLAVFAILTRPRAKTPPPASFHGRDSLLSDAEREMFAALARTIGHRHQLLAKVRLTEVVQVSHRESLDDGQRHRLDTSHVDFLLCQPRTLKPRLALLINRPTASPDELEHASTESDGQAATDETTEFVAQVLSQAGLPCVTMSADQRSDARQLRRLIAEQLR
jgi:hypothetical protein